jgi:hypothetical protein
VKEPYSPQAVGCADEEVMDEVAVALNAVTELGEVLLIRVVNVRIDEVVVEVAVDNELAATDSVHVSSAGDVGLAELGWTEVVDPDVDIDVH